MEGLKNFLLTRIEPYDFLRLVRNVLLTSGYFELNPIDGHNDHGVDIELFTFNFRNSQWVVQVSVQENAQRKVAETIDRIKTRHFSPTGIVYITNRKISNTKRSKIQKNAMSHGYLLHIFDEQWLLPRIDVDESGNYLVACGGVEEETTPEGKGEGPPGFLVEVFHRVHLSLSSMDPNKLPQAYRSLAACMLSFQLRQKGYVQKALSKSQEAHRLAIRLDNPILKFLTSHLHGEVLKSLGRQDEAANLFRECLTYSRQNGEASWEAVAITNLAETDRRIEEAIKLSVKAGDMRQSLDLPSEFGISLGQLSKLTLRRGDAGSALLLAEESCSVFRSMADPNRGVAKANLHAASALIMLGELEQAFKRCQEAESVLTEQDDGRSLVRARLLMIDTMLRWQSNFNDFNGLVLKTYGNCIELADGEGLRKLLTILETHSWSKSIK